MVVQDRGQLQNILAKADLYLSVQRFEAAEKLLKTAILDFGSVANLQNHLGLVYHQQARFEEALVEFKKAIEINSGYVEAGLNLAVTLCDLSRYDEARKVFDSVMAQTSSTRKQPDLVLGRIANQHFELGRFYMDAALYHDAVREFRKALGILERMSDVRLQLVKCLLALGQLDKAKEELQILIQQSGQQSSSEYYSLLGWVEMKLGRLEIAKNNWVKAQELDSSDTISKAYLRLLGGSFIIQNQKKAQDIPTYL
jgi:tetratricopeptide (TPR) repeat protein